MENKGWNRKLSFDWISLAYLILSPVTAFGGTAIYIYYNGVHWMDVTLLASFYLLSGISITAGYHRYYSHRTHEAHPLLQLFYLIFGALAIQQPVRRWARNHRVHHQYTDTELDPHNIKQGFFYAHMGWILINRPLDKDYSTVKDLNRDNLVCWQERFYWPIVFLVGVGLPVFFGWLVGRPFGGFLWGALLRNVLQNQVIFSINSVAHTWGKKRFSSNCEARDSLLLGIMALGEGYHSYHHRFAFDYRNGWRWYHFDPTKWFIQLMSVFGLARRLRRASPHSILKAEILTQKEVAERMLSELPQEKATTFQEHLEAQYARLNAYIDQWSQAKQHYRQLQKQGQDAAREELERLKQTLREYYDEVNQARRDWHEALRSLQAQVSVAG